MDVYTSIPPELKDLALGKAPLAVLLDWMEDHGIDTKLMRIQHEHIFANCRDCWLVWSIEKGIPVNRMGDPPINEQNSWREQR